MLQMKVSTAHCFQLSKEMFCFVLEWHGMNTYKIKHTHTHNEREFNLKICSGEKQSSKHYQVARNPKDFNFE